jgi:hypothetical protein
MIAHLNVTSPPPFIVDLILIEDLTFFLSLELLRRTWSHFMGPKPHKQMNNHLWRHL